MIMIIFYSFLYVLFIFVDLVPIYRDKKWKLFWVYSIITVVSYIMIILISVDVKIPSPAPIIKKAVTSIFNL